MKFDFFGPPLFCAKLRQKTLFCPGGGGGAPWKWNGFGSGMERAPRPHPQGKKSFFGVIFAQNYAKIAK